MTEGIYSLLPCLERAVKKPLSAEAEGRCCPHLLMYTLAFLTHQEGPQELIRQLSVPGISTCACWSWLDLGAGRIEIALLLPSNGSAQF